ncbi:uncharacterized protein [Drosophila virilis]|uniref:Uncharacterized protein n=1 Tax=Drosophila virilis TaxID=7244 RepID=A0A0Q9WFE8_DROVI|nr:uncharacterized protein LOC26530785 [Drosophila virilis]KRF83340.1 uncharacterized protein Dvir_GJ26015 [Drosophila virilis]
MAPFSICSKCKARTRKVVKDPITLKDIYLCPKCCKAKNETQNIENEQDSKELRRTQLELPALELKKLPLAAVVGATSHSSSRKCTPPIMQTVIINGRKYIAISATASDN